MEKFLLIIIFLYPFGVLGYSGGAPRDGACEFLMPRHNTSVAQEDVSPFVLQLNTTDIKNGAPIEVTLQSTGLTTVNFKGFIIQARESIDVYQTFGQFLIDQTSSAIMKTLECQNIDDTLTHSNPETKEIIRFVYKPPTGYSGQLRLVATVVQDFRTFFTKISSNTIIVQSDSSTTSTTSSPPKTFYNDCSISKSCFGHPRNCITDKNCLFAVSVAKQQEKFLFELISFQSNAAYVAVAVSSSEFMSETTVMECVRESDNSLKAYDSWMNPVGTRRDIVRQDISNLVGSESDQSMFLCRIERPSLTNVNGVEFDLIQTPYRLLLASGRQVTDTGISYHDLGRAASSESYLGNVGEFSSSSNLLYKLHGIFMFIAWIGTSSIGVIFARYFKGEWPGVQFKGKDLWFVNHRAFMIATWLLTMTAFILIFVKNQAWSRTNDLHPILGVITTFLCFIQPFGAYFRPPPYAPKRIIFNWGHFLIGNSAHLFGVITIFFAVPLAKAELPYSVYYLLITFVIYYLIIHTIFSIVMERDKSSLKSNQVSNGFSKKIWLGIHVISIIGLTIAGIILIVIENPLR